MTEIQLTVEKAYPTDTGKGIARIAPSSLEELELSPGAFVAIEGEQTAVMKAQRADPEDWEEDIIRIDGFARDNAGVALGERATVRSASIQFADEVTLAPTDEIQIPLNPDVVGIVKQQLLHRSVTQNNLVPITAQSTQPFLRSPGDTLTFVATDVDPATVVEVTDDTTIKVRETPVSQNPEVRTEDGITYDEIGGLQDELDRVREMIELPLNHPKLFDRLGIEPPKGVLLYGPPGTGKTLLAKAVANETAASFHSIAGPEIISKYYGESEQELRDTFEEAQAEAPAIIFIDELDSIAPSREEVTGEVERRVVAQLLSLMDGLDDRGEVVVIGATNRHDAVDAALRRPGRFDREIEIDVPNEADREEILRIHTRAMPLAKDVHPSDLATQTQGFVGADLESLTKEAAMHALRRYLPEIDIEEDEIPPSLVEQIVVKAVDFERALSGIEPSALREVDVRIPEVTWKHVGGLDTVKQELRESVVWPLDSPEKFERLGIDAVSGVLLYGPPGTGKTLLAKVVANETDANFIPVRGPELLSKWVGESEEAIREVFQKARNVSPSIVFFDELDSLATSRAQGPDGGSSDRVVNQLLTELDGLQSMEDVVVIGATNRPDMLDAALLRTGRFGRLIKVEEPTFEDREQILKVHTEETPLASDVSFRELAEQTDGYVGSDLENLTREAAIEALRDDMEVISMRHFDRAIDRIRPTMTDATSEYYERIDEELDRERWPNTTGSGPRGFQ
ncbi:CDC48 family AAA ATPase [Halobacterium zhouii]|uniref:CDC48 family AAA ATPase n=1 Tax=Halobacterium zhouii TaxID=2902624 RepID=UPI001E568E5D|nr:CDC48 family AAA ATPase [Halobacterium zhouii]